MVEFFGGLLIFLIIIWMMLMITMAVLEYMIGMRVLSFVRSLFERDDKPMDP